jgi:inhibitor of KinA sporulation pathway (predicted exonuclease)
VSPRLAPPPTTWGLGRPTEQPLLTRFCRSFTSISQNDVDAAAPLAETLRRFTQWLATHGLVERPRGALAVTCDPPASPVTRGKVVGGGG